jgi:CubicO group peptidase (beta-lactamase class C family)
MNGKQLKYSWLLFVLIVSFCLLPLETSAGISRSEFNNAIADRDTPYWPTHAWQISTPDEQNMDADLLAQMFASIDAQGLNIDAVVVVRNGYIVAEKYYPPYEQDTLHEMYSVTKSVISALVGIAIQEGAIQSVDDLVLDYFPQRSFENDDQLKRSITLEDLLSMSSGLAWDYQKMVSSRDWVQYTLDQPMSVEPGTTFHYNSGNSHVLSAIIQTTGGMSTRDFAQNYLFDPLGISELRWQKDVDGIYKGGWGMAMTPRDMAKLGYLYLKQGQWDGQQVLPAEWVSASTRPYVQVQDTLEAWDIHVGYSWWLHENGIYAAHGMKGQFIYVIPHLELVAVITANIPDSEFHLPQLLIRDYIIPAVRSTDDS